MTHSPKPWEWDAPISDYIVGRDTDGSRFIVASVNEYILVGEKDANGRLIAAAPIMYEFIVSQAKIDNQEARDILTELDLLLPP